MKDVYVVMVKEPHHNGLCYDGSNDVFETKELHIAKAFAQKLRGTFKNHQDEPEYIVCKLVPVEVVVNNSSGE